MNRISAKIIADSKNEFGERITSFVLVFPRIILAELNTHRMLSRNSASSRAIPFKTMLEKVENEPFVPIKWQKDHSGMQGTEYFIGEEIKECIELWLRGRDTAIRSALELHQYKVTKQLANRLLEPFLYHTVIITGTEWENFFALRAHPQAEIHIADLAEKMLIAYNNSVPKKLKAGDWHIPFGDSFNKEKLQELWLTEGDEELSSEIQGIEKLKIKIATARCARVSYLNFEGKDDYMSDLKLFDILSKSGHWSPFEHCARVMSQDEYFSFIKESPDSINKELISTEYGRSGNFKGFIQYRKMFEGESKKDERVLKL